jgi:hypothetical protein
MKHLDQIDLPSPITDEQTLKIFSEITTNPDPTREAASETQNETLDQGFFLTFMRLVNNPGKGGAMLLLTLISAFLFLSDLNLFKINQYLNNLPPLIEAPNIYQQATTSISENSNKDIFETEQYDKGYPENTGKINTTKYFKKIPNLPYVHRDIKPVDISYKRKEPTFEILTQHYDPGNTRIEVNTRLELIRKLYKSNFSYCDKLGYRLDLDNPELIFTQETPENELQLNLKVMKNLIASYHSKKAEQFNTAYAIWKYNEKINEQLDQLNHLKWQTSSTSSAIDSITKRSESRTVSCKIVFISAHADCSSFSVEKDKSYVLLAEAVEKFKNKSMHYADSKNKTNSANSNFDKALLEQLLYRTGPDDNWKILTTDQMHFISNPGGKIEICTDIPATVDTNEYLIKLFSYTTAAYLNGIENSTNH